MPTQTQQARDAIREMNEALREVLQEWRDIWNSEDYKKGKKGARKKVKALKQKYGNLKKVIEALNGAEIVEDPSLPSNVLGRAEPHSNPQKILLSEKLAEMRDEAVAQILAHEAIHLIIKSRRNSLEEEVLCRKKEVEVWELLKGDENHPGDIFCNEEQKRMALPEFDYKMWIFNQYLSIHGMLPPYIDKGPSRKKKNKLRIASSSGLFRQFLDETKRYIRTLIELIVVGQQTTRAYSFETVWPSDYDWTEIKGDEDRYQQIIGSLIYSDSDVFPAVVSVTEEADIVHGGQWAEFTDLVEYKRDLYLNLNADLLDTNTRILQDEPMPLGDLPGHCLDIEFDQVFEIAPEDNRRRRIRTRTLFTKHEETIIHISLTCEAKHWAEREAALEELTQGFRVYE